MVNFEEGLSVRDFKTRPLPMLRADTAMYASSHLCERGQCLRCVLSLRRGQLCVMRKCHSTLTLHRASLCALC